LLARGWGRDDPEQFLPVHPLCEAPVKKHLSTILAAALLAAGVACSSTPTAPATATHGEWQANTTPPTDSTSNRTPNMFGSGN
jgi:hypothetical protein